MEQQQVLKDVFKYDVFHYLISLKLHMDVSVMAVFLF
jgi:hypothetical protein